MKIKELPIESELQEKIQILIDKQLAYIGIKIEILDMKDKIITVRSEQVQLKNNFILSQKQIIERVKPVFDLLKGYVIRYRAISYNPKFNKLDHNWIIDKMREFNLSRNDIIKQMSLDKSTLSLLLSGNKILTRFQKAAFYYYFMTFVLNKEQRK